MRAAAALMRHAARVQRRTPVAARRWRKSHPAENGHTMPQLKNDDDDDGGPSP